MARFAALLTFITTAATLSTVYAGPVGGPACAAQNKGQPDCFEKCKTSWGFNGGTLGADRWGPVVVPSKTLASINEYIAKACGLSAAPEPTASKPAGRIEVPAVANAGGVPSTAYSSPVATSREVSGSSASSLPTISLVAAPSVSSSALPSASVVPPAENLNVPERPTSQAPPPPPPTTEAPPPPAPTTQAPPPPPPAPTTEAPRPRPTTQAPAPQPTPVTPPATGGARQEWLDTHNAVRARHGANPVTWGDDLEAAALRWAQGCVFQHSGGAVGKFGENLAAGTGNYTPTKAVDGWAAEVSQYNPSNPQFSHFTQVVWKATTRIGCATAVCNNLIAGFNGPTQYHVCEYDPPGNFAGRFAENVQV